MIRPLVRTALPAAAVAVLLSGCAGGAAPGRTSVSTDPTTGAPTTAPTTAAARPSGTAAGAAEVSAAATSSQPAPGVLPPFDKLHPNDHPSILISAGDDGGTHRITVQPATVETSTDVEGWGMATTSARPRTYPLAPGAQIVLSRRLAGLPVPDNGSDLAKVTWQQFTRYARGGNGPVELFFQLDSRGRIALLYQQYHP